MDETATPIIVDHNGSYAYYYYYLVNNSDLADYYYRDDSPAHYDIFFNSVRKYTAIFGLMLCISTIVVNLLVITVCMRDSKFRKDIFYLQIINFSIVNTLIGGFVIPLTIYTILQPWNLGDFLCKVWILSDVYLPFVSLIILILLGLDRLMALTRAETYSCLFQQCLKQILLSGPWLISFVLVVPIWTHGSYPYELEPGECMIMLSKSVAFSGSIITYFVPSVCVIFISLTIVLVRLGHRGLWISNKLKKQSTDSLVTSSEIVIEDPPEPQQTTKKNQKTATTQSIVAVFLSSFLLCSMWFPFQCTNLLISFCTSQLCMPSPILSQVVTWMATASSCIVPMAWLVETKLRRGCESILCGGTKQSCDDNNEESV